VKVIWDSGNMPDRRYKIETFSNNSWGTERQQFDVLICAKVAALILYGGVYRVRIIDKGQS